MFDVVFSISATAALLNGNIKSDRTLIVDGTDDFVVDDDDVDDDDDEVAGDEPFIGFACVELLKGFDCVDVGNGF